MRVDPAEAEVVRRIFREAAEGLPFTRIAKRPNEDGVPGRIRSAHGWTVGSARRLLENTKYPGTGSGTSGAPAATAGPGAAGTSSSRNRSGWSVTTRISASCRRHSGTGSRSAFARSAASGPAARPVVASVPDNAPACTRTRPTFSRERWSAASAISSIALGSGHRGSHYGCSAAARRACGNRVRVRRRVAEKVILAALRDRVLQPDPSCGSWLLSVSKSPSSVRMCPGCSARRGRSSLRFAVVSPGSSTSWRSAVRRTAWPLPRRSPGTRRRWRRSRPRSRAFSPRPTRGCAFPSGAWVEKRLAALRELLERRTEASAFMLRRLLGRMVLEPVHPEQGTPYYVARTAIDVLVLLESPRSDPGSDPGASSFGWWTRTQRLRTDPRLPLEVPLGVALEPPLYQRIAPEAARFRALGLSDQRIAARLRVDAKTVAKAIRWFHRRVRR